VETWRSVVGYEGLYEVSDLGNVRSIDRAVPTKNGRIYRFRGVQLRQVARKDDGRRSVTLSKLGHEMPTSVHVIVLEAFHGPRPPGLDGCHSNGDNTDNRAVNLRWDTVTENMLDKGRHGTDHQRNKERCPLGHKLLAPNIRAYDARLGRRGCLACSRARGVEQKAKRAGRPFDFRAVANQKYADIMGAAA
jgi:hypothetical protein